jgi:hypothetical protein
MQTNGADRPGARDMMRMQGKKESLETKLQQTEAASCWGITSPISAHGVDARLHGIYRLVLGPLTRRLYSSSILVVYTRRLY